MFPFTKEIHPWPTRTTLKAASRSYYQQKSRLFWPVGKQQGEYSVIIIYKAFPTCSLNTHALDVPIQFNPPMVKLAHHGDKRRIIVMLKLPHDINFGLYHTCLMIEGLPELKYRLVVTVEKPLPVKPKSENQNQASKRTSGKSRKTGAKRKKSLARE